MSAPLAVNERNKRGIHSGRWRGRPSRAAPRSIRPQRQSDVERTLRERLHGDRSVDPQSRRPLVDAFLYRHLRRLYGTFGGDLLLPLLLGEIAYRNIAMLGRSRPRGGGAMTASGSAWAAWYRTPIRTCCPAMPIRCPWRPGFLRRRSAARSSACSGRVGSRSDPTTRSPFRARRYKLIRSG